MVSRLLIAAGFAAALLGCGGGGSGPDRSCPQDLPAGCPSPAPSYAGEVAGIIQSRCLACHGPGGAAADKPLGSQAEIASRRGAVLNQVYACRMPQPGAPQLTAEERTALLGWLVCGAPNN